MLNSQPRSLHSLFALTAFLSVSAHVVAQSADTSTEEVVLAPVEVTATPAAYAPPADSSIGKGGVPLSENPQNITVVTRSELDDKGVVRLEDAIRGVAGVQVGGYYSNWDYFRIRGFAADFNTYIDGLRGTNGMGEETFALEQIEVVKGPAALYGQGPLGGLVNTVSKRPKDDAFTTIGATVGSYDYYESTIDYNQPLNADKTLLFRFNTLYREQQSNIDYVNSERFYLAPSLTWKIGPSTQLTVLARYRDFEGTFDMPLPAIGTALPNPNGPISSDLYVGISGSNGGTETYKQIGYELTHEFNDSLKLTQNFRYNRYNQVWDDTMYPASFPAPFDTLFLAAYDYRQKWNYAAIDTRLDGTFEQGALEHNVTFGVDYYRENRDSASSLGLGWFDPLQLTPLNVYNPVYTGIPPQAMTPFTGSESMKEITGIYLQDHLKLPGRVTFTAGARLDYAETNGQKDHEITPRVGGTWEFIPGTTAYVSYSQAFNPQTGTTGPVDPETGDNMEVGLRNQSRDGRLASTIALFQINREDVATPSLIIGGPTVTTGEQRSRGVEFDTRYTPVKGWDLLAAYAYTDTEVVEDNSIPEGVRMIGVPLHTFNAWTKYTLQEGLFRGVGFGIGASYYSAQEGDTNNTFELPGYTLWQAALYYTRGPFSAQLNVTNVFDKHYYSGSYDSLYVMPGEPRLFRLSASWTF